MTQWANMTPEQRVHLLTTIWRPDMTSQMIADAVGATKGSITGFYRRHRQKLADVPLGDNAVEMRRKMCSSKRKSRAKTPEQKAADAQKRKDLVEERKSLIDWDAIGYQALERFPRVHSKLRDSEYDDAGLMVLLEENNGCKWPLNDGGPYLFCGHDRLGKYSYCARHQERSVGRGTEGERRALSVSARHVSS